MRRVASLPPSVRPRSERGGNPLRRVAQAALLLLALQTQHVVAATIALGVEDRGGEIDIAGSALLNADAETAWRVLTDYERYVDFIPGLQQSRVGARNGTTVTVEQSGDVTLWLLHLPLDVTFEIVEVAPVRLESRVVAGDLRALDSRYVLTPVGDSVRLEYTGKLDSGLALFGAIERLAVKQNCARRFQALADEIERRGRTAIGSPRPRASAAAAK
jgi:carbon monoxide dehydrogenase subunit G